MTSIPKLLILWVALLFAGGSHAQQPERRIALTFDDIPRQRGAFLSPDERTDKLIAALKTAGVRQAAFFVNPGRLELPDGVGGEARIAAYVKAGHVIANHSFKHQRLSTVAPQDYLADIDQTEAWLRGREGYRPWFRFPYLDEGGRDKEKRDAVRKGLRERGLRNGYVTADGSDWNLETLTIEAAAAGKQMDMEALRKLYVTSQMSGVEYHDELARRTLGRSPAHILLLHETDLAALFIGDLVAELKRHGWTIITVDEAFSDAMGEIEPDVPFAAGTLTGSIAWERDVKPPLWPIWMSTVLVRDLFERRVVKASDTQPSSN
jgi:peptidoglycan/xylan/chitin deacetylase (PgdA/CDA1 family)